MRGQRGRWPGQLAQTQVWWVVAALIIALGMLVRLALIIVTPDLEASGMDGPSYQASALAIVKQGVFADVWQIRVFPPGYSMLLALTYVITGTTTPIWLLGVQSLALVTSALYLACRTRSLLGPWASLLLLALCVLTPATIEVSTSLMYEGFLVPLSMVFCGAVISWVRTSGRAGLIPMIACSFGLVAIHPRSLVIPVAIGLTLLVGVRKVLAPALMAVGALMPLPLLAVRNYMAQGTPNLSSNLGSNLVMGLPSDSEATCAAEVFSPSDYPRLNPTDDARFLDCGRREILNDPLAWTAQAPGKLVDHFEPAFLRIVSGDRAPIQLIDGEIVNVIRVGSLILLIAFSFAGFLWLWRHPVAGPTLAIAVTLPVALTAATSVVFYGRERFSYPALGFALFVGVSGILGLLPARHRQRLASSRLDRMPQSLPQGPSDADSNATAN